MHFPLNVGTVYELPNALRPGDTIEFHSSTVDLTPSTSSSGLDNTVLNILSANSNERLLHMSFRRRNPKIIRLTSRDSNGKWLKATDLKPLTDYLSGGQPCTITVREQQDCFDILVNGTLLYKYPKQVYRPVTRIAYSTEPKQRTTIFDPRLDVNVVSSGAPPSTYEDAYFRLKPEDVAKESENDPFDIVIIGSGIGGGVLATALLEKNARVLRSGFSAESTEDDPTNPHWGVRLPLPNLPQPDQPKRILVIEKGRLTFHTHCMNGPRPSNSGTTSQGNDLFYKKFKEPVDMDEETAKIWMGGPVYCLGGRGAVWGLFAPRFNIDTLEEQFPKDVASDLLNEYYLKAEKLMQVYYPSTLPPHQALIDRLNLHTNKNLPKTQWQWGRIATEFRTTKNYDFAGGAYSAIDKLLETAMNDPTGESPYFKTILGCAVQRIEPAPQPGKVLQASHVVIRDSSGAERKIFCKKAVIGAGSIDSAALLLRSADGDPTKFGSDFARSFGHVTDHRILAVSMPFFYRTMADRDVIGGMKLQTDIQFRIKKGGEIVDDSTAIANISLDAVSFLPRDDASNDLLPVLIIAYILPSDLALDNKVELNSANEPRIHCGWAPDKYIDDKKAVLAEFALDVMNKIVDVFDVRFAKQTSDGYTPVLHDTTGHVTLADIQLNEAGPGVVAHELGTIPMPNKDNFGGIVDSNLQMKYGWDNVSVCDLSIFPYSPAANPTLSLAAMALRLSDKLFPTPNYAPIVIFNLTGHDVTVNISQSKPDTPSVGPKLPITIAAGKSAAWKIAQRESMMVYSCMCATSYDVQMVYPGVNAMIVKSPPVAIMILCRCN